MERIDLIATAQKLPQVSEKLANEYSTKRDALVNKMNAIMEARPDLIDMVGANNIEMMKDNHANHARFLESLFYQHSAEILVDTVLWVFRAYRSRNFNSTYWAAQLNTWIEIYKKELSSDCYKAIYPYYNWMQINIPNFVKLADDKLNAPNSSH
jgi:hypothetical protein